MDNSEQATKELNDITKDILYMSADLGIRTSEAFTDITTKCRDYVKSIDESDEYCVTKLNIMHMLGEILNSYTRLVLNATGMLPAVMGFKSEHINLKDIPEEIAEHLNKLEDLGKAFRKFTKDIQDD